MIKLIFCLQRLPELTREDFQAYWRDKHAPLVRSVAPTLRIVRYVQSHTISHPHLGNILAARGVTRSFDGVAELWWNSIEDMMAAGATEQGAAAALALYEDEQKFIDLVESELLFAEEFEVV